ncbi:MAG: hypothetical protein A2538_03290 [Candidatus Magasanikbacteria bacterium RIFOXYD2_FULL_41_14]|uniref:DDH domain-containing protein n=1 Tax=Candidatus Magasanikbacteria bacterium RIFOXYD2_FULL_41_14 TaxID=1798709 RepID=A0A1F6PCS7_9BACT|nr:MAG: hypothetical protein A2538_03290 [Candidatus Magasanikbacteria bacterium RIFOXYD2_FULL_41_14]
MQTIAKQIYSRLLSANKILIVSHQNPDGDTLGAGTGLLETLKNAGKSARLFCATPAPAKFNYLPHHDTITSDPSVFTDPDVDTVVVLDSGDLRYAGVHIHLYNHLAEIINIDHHPTNELFGTYNLVRPDYSSTSEIIFHFLRFNGAHLNPASATALLTGIITDTDSFTNAATSVSAMAAASELIATGANLNLINDRNVKNKTVGSLRLWGLVLSRLTKHSDELVSTYVKNEDWLIHDVSETESEGIANFLNNLDSAKAALILKETSDGKIKGSFRTTRDDTDVSAMAKKLGGGGHKKAAGFTVEGTIESVLDIILTETGK